jgi:hypothetical protein
MSVGNLLRPIAADPHAAPSTRTASRADVRFFDTGHFALETHAEPIALAMREFLSR